MEVSRKNYYAISFASFFVMVMVFSEHRIRYAIDSAAAAEAAASRGERLKSADQSPQLSVVDIPGLSPLTSGTTTQTAFAGQRQPLAAAEAGAVPKYVHLVWFYPPDSNLRFHHLMCLMSIKLHIKPRRIILWYSHQPKGPWWAFAKKAVSEIALVQYAAPTEVFNQSVSIVEHQSDVARLDILIKYGGIYFDLDVVALRDFEPLLHYPVTLGAESPDLLGSGVILAQPNATFLRLWRDEYRNYEPTKWNYNSVVVPMELAKRHAAFVHIEWFAIHRPNWFERDWLYTEGKLWDWSENFAVHLWYRTHDRDYDPITIRTLNTTVGEIFRFIYYGSPRLFKT